MDLEEIRKQELRRKLNPNRDEAHQMKRRWLTYGVLFKIGIGMVVLIAALVTFTIMQTPEKIEGDPQVCFKNDICIDVILALTPEEQEIGLSNYSSLPEDTGMLFIFETADVVRIWMKDMDFHIDIFWITPGDRIGYVKKKAVPCDSPPCELFEPGVPAKFVLETREGFAIESNLYVGDKVEFKNIPRNLLQ